MARGRPRLLAVGPARPSASVEISPCLLLRQIHLVGPADRFGALPIGLGVGGQQAASLAKPISSRPAEGLESTRMVPFRSFARARCDGDPLCSVSHN